jgi:uncharacterized metal-binding protein YceD (DUF177 family)
LKAPANETDFTWLIEIDRIPRVGQVERLKANTAECAIAASILKVPAVHALTAHLDVTPWQGGGIKVEGTATADMTLLSVISLEEFKTSSTVSIKRFFVSKRLQSDANDEVDVDVIKGRKIDLASLCLETIALELDPYPRKPGEVFASEERGDEGAKLSNPSENGERPSAFAKLAKLREK